jgi:hypothetical protein
MPVGGAQTGVEPSATLPSLRRSRARPEPERRRGQTTARGPEPSGRGKPSARVWCGYASARGDARARKDVKGEHPAQKRRPRRMLTQGRLEADPGGRPSGEVGHD